MRPDAELRFEITRVGESGDDFKPPVIEAQKRPDTDIIDARFDRPVQRRHSPVVVALGPGRMHLGIGLAVVCLLEDLVGAYIRGLELAKSSTLSGAQLNSRGVVGVALLKLVKPPRRN